MNLPENVLQLIREYSKPLTHPYWRFGTPHALLIKNSPTMKHIIRQIKNDLKQVRIYSIHLLKCKFGESIFDTDQKFIEQYGEEILHFTYPNYDKPFCINFYMYAKLYLINTTHFHLTLHNVHGNLYYEYVYVKNVMN